MVDSWSITKEQLSDTNSTATADFKQDMKQRTWNFKNVKTLNKAFWLLWQFNSLIHSRYFHSASSSPLLLRGAPYYSTDTASEITRRSATGNCEWRTCPRSLHGGWSGIWMKAQNLPRSHHALQNCYFAIVNWQ